MLKHLFMTTAILVALGSSSIAQDAAGTGTAAPSDAATEPTAALEPGQAAQTGGGQAGTVDAALVREVRQMALEAEKKAAKPEPPKSEEAVAAEKQAIEGHRDSFFARVDARQQ